MRNGNLIKRIESIYRIIEHYGGEASSRDVAKAISQPLGTISSCLSYMVRGGYLYRNNGLYSIRVKSDFREVAAKIRSFVKAHKSIQARTKIKNFQTEIDDYAAETSRAVELLKSKGYKILAPVTEFKEI
jgi:hypothetical protein